MTALRRGKIKGELIMKKLGLEYQMTKQMFNELLKTRREEEKKLNPYVFVMKVINETFGIKGEVTHVSIYEN